MVSPGLLTSDSLRVNEHILQAIGQAPLVRLSKIDHSLPCPLYPAHTLLADVLPAVVEGQVILVMDGERPAGILTKIDVLDFIAPEI